MDKGISQKDNIIKSEDDRNKAGDIAFAKIIFKYLFLLLFMIWLGIISMKVLEYYSYNSIDNTLPIENIESQHPVDKALKDLIREFNRKVSTFEARYDARIKAMELNADMVKYGAAITGVIVTITLGFFAYFAGRNIQANTKLVNDTVNDIRKIMDEESEKIHDKLPEIIVKIAEGYIGEEKGVDDEYETNGKKGDNDYVDGYENAFDARIGRGIFVKMYNMIKEHIERDLQAERKSFDPLVEYKALAREVRKRHEKSREAAVNPAAKIPLEETIDDPAFRRRAASVFEKILDDLDREESRRTIDSVELYNMAATASQMDMDFVALELMRRANKFSNGDWLDKLLKEGQWPEQLQGVEIAARYVRQLLSMDEITYEEAKKAITAVMRAANALDLHLVVSEAYNIGLKTASPSQVADLIRENLPEHLREVSYVLLNSARLKYLSGLPEHVKEGEKLFLSGLDAFAKETPAARWFEHSAKELATILREDPDLARKHEDRIRHAIRPQRTVQDFLLIYKKSLTQWLNENDWLKDYVEQLPDAERGGY